MGEVALLGLAVLVAVCGVRYNMDNFRSDRAMHEPRSISVPDSATLDSLLAHSWGRGGKLPNYDFPIETVTVRIDSEKTDKKNLFKVTSFAPPRKAIK